MGKARNASSGDKGQSHWKARELAAEPRSGPVPGTGVHRWHWGGGNHKNVAGALKRHLSWSDTPVRDAADQNLNNQARKEVLAEQTDDALDASEDNAAAIARRLRWEDDYDDHYRDDLNEAGLDSLADLPPNVTFNGLSAEAYDPEEAYDPYDYGYDRYDPSYSCTECHLEREIERLKARIKELENAR